MDRAFATGAAGSPPTPPASPSIGYPTAGNPGIGTSPTKPGPWWYHMITEEQRAVIVAAGLTPDQTNVGQLLAAMRSAGVFQTQAANDRSTKAATTEFANPVASLADSGYQKLPSGLIIQWGSFVQGAGIATITFPMAFPSKVLAFAAVANYAGLSNAYFACFNGSSLSQALAGIWSSTTVLVPGAAASWIAVGH